MHNLAAIRFPYVLWLYLPKPANACGRINVHCIIIAILVPLFSIQDRHTDAIKHRLFRNKLIQKLQTFRLTSSVARIRKIINADDDIPNCSNNAAFVIAVATEMFVQHLVERTHEIIKAEKKPRRNVQYNDVGSYRKFSAVR